MSLLYITAMFPLQLHLKSLTMHSDLPNKALRLCASYEVARELAWHPKMRFPASRLPDPNYAQRVDLCEAVHKSIFQMLAKQL
jgi:hypothetical protein